MRVLLDTSVVLDLFLNRPPWAADVAKIWDAHRRGHLDALLAAFAVPTLFYVVRRQTDLATDRVAVQSCRATLAIAPTDGAGLRLAEAMTGPDFEDNCQVACAMQTAADAIVTRDPRGFAHSPIPVLTPADVVARLPAPFGP